MSAFRRILTTIPGSRRSYSSFFSSKPGGGRYFNSAKPKAAVVAPQKDSSTKDASTTSSTPGAPQDASSAVHEVANSSPRQASVELAEAVEDLTSLQISPQAHPIVNVNDFKLQQFFSLHRPLLLLHNPPSIFNPGPPIDTIFSTSGQTKAKEDMQPRPISIFEDLPGEASLDADAEAARQIARALTLNKAGAASTWEATLKRLGLDPSKEPERVEMQEQLNKEWEDVQILLDSTKRKRRKKMKKHKLKKRRKATRSSRLKLK